MLTYCDGAKVLIHGTFLTVVEPLTSVQSKKRMEL